MEQNDLKKYTVKVGNGSGCVFQPMDSEHTYILTAKHLFETKNEDTHEVAYLENGTEIIITFYYFDGDRWEAKPITFKVELNENFFPHNNKEVDAAILKMTYLEGYSNIHIRGKRINNDYYLCGFPGRQRSEDGAGDDYDSFKVREFKQSGNFFDVVVLNNDIITKEEVVGTSGGGILAYQGNNIFLTGIQSRMAADVDLSLGRVGFIPIKYFEEIVEENKENGKLEELLPVFLKSFVSLIGETFQMRSAPIHKEEAVLSELLTIQAQLIRKSDITPLALKSFLGSERLLVKSEDNVELRRKKTWTFWLELLVILNIAKEKVHNTEDLETITNNIRFFYSNTESDFLDEHLQDLWKIDYSDLNDGGLVIYASNKSGQTEVTKGAINLGDIVPDIASAARREYAQAQFEEAANARIDISNTHKFPFDRFLYANITAFKEDAALELDENFINMNPEDCYPLLKELYERLLP